MYSEYLFKNTGPKNNNMNTLFVLSGTASQSKRQPSWFSRPSPATLWPQCHPPSKPSTLCCLTARASGSTCRKWPSWRRAKSLKYLPPRPFLLPAVFVLFWGFFPLILQGEKRVSVRDLVNLKKRRLFLKAGNLFLHYVCVFPILFLFSYLLFTFGV